MWLTLLVSCLDALAQSPPPIGLEVGLLGCTADCRVQLAPGSWDASTLRRVDGDLVIEAGDPAAPPELVGLAVVVGRGAHLELRDVDIRGNGRQPVAVVDGGSVVIDGVTLDGLGAPGIVGTDSDVRVTGSTVQGTMGTAIAAQGGALELIDTIVRDNVTDDAVVSCVAARCRVDRAVFTGNNATGTADVLRMSSTTGSEIEGSVFCGETVANGSVIDVQWTEADLVGNVVANNTSDEDIVRVSSSDVVLRNNHLVGNAAGDTPLELVWSTVDLRNGLIWANTAGDPEGVVDEWGATVTTGYNLFFDNQPAHSAVPLDPTDLVDIEPQTNGGPFTCALGLLRPTPGSPLIDGGDPAFFDTNGSRSDIGALSPGMAPGTTTPPTTTPPTTTTDPTDPGDPSDPTFEDPGILHGVAGCTCASSGPGGSLGLAVVLAVFARRRRTEARACEQTRA